MNHPQGHTATVRLTMAQALVRYLTALKIHEAVPIVGNMPLFGGVFSIFGHGNVAGIGEALYHYKDQLPTYRAHNEQAMALAAIAYAKTQGRKRMMAVTTSIGPGATNLLTAAATAHVNRLPVLLLPGDTFVSRRPDPVLQQLEDCQDGTISVNDAFKPLSRYFDRIVHPEQLLTALPRAIEVLTNAAECGPVTLALPQDVQTMAYDYPESFFHPKPIIFRAQAPDPLELEAVVTRLKSAKKPLIIAGGGVVYAGAMSALRHFAEAHQIPVAETQAGKGSLAWDHPLQLGAIGVTGSPAANLIAAEADVVIAVGSRLQDFTTGSHSLFKHAHLISVNVNTLDALKWHATGLVTDAKLGLMALSDALSLALSQTPPLWQAEQAWSEFARSQAQTWRETVTEITGRRDILPPDLPYDGEVIGAVQRSSLRSAKTDTVVAAGGTLPAELHKLWRTELPQGYHVEYGYSCMGYEIAGALGVKLAAPKQEVIVMVGDGSYLMMNSEIATSVMLGMKLIIVVQDNQGYGCINRLQQACGGAPFNNLWEDCLQGEYGAPKIDFAAHAQSLGALSEHVDSIAELEQALERARKADRTYLICINTDDTRTTETGGCWWEVAIPAVSERDQVNNARTDYMQARLQQKV